MTQSLPSEICDGIIGILDTDTAQRRKALQTTSLVCRTWRVFSQPRLFCPCSVFAFVDSSFAEIREREQEGPWLAWLANAPGAARQTQKITIRRWPTSLPPAKITLLISELSKTFPLLESIRVDLRSGAIPWIELDWLIPSFTLLKDLVIAYDGGASQRGPGLNMGVMQNNIQYPKLEASSNCRMTIELTGYWRSLLSILLPGPRAPVAILHTLVLKRACISSSPDSDWHELRSILVELEGLKSLNIGDLSLRLDDDDIGQLADLVPTR